MVRRCSAVSDFDHALTAALAIAPLGGCDRSHQTDGDGRCGGTRWSRSSSASSWRSACAAAGWFGMSFDEWPDALLVGLTSGLVSAGLYSGAKAAVNGTASAQ